MTVRNCRRAIYRRQDEPLPSARFHWLEPVAGLFHLQMNFISMLFGKFWGIPGNIVSLNRFAGILKRKYISKAAENGNFHHSDNFFRTVIEAMVITLYINAVGCQSIDKLQNWIGRFDWPSLISKIKHDCLRIFKVHSIREAASHKTAITVASMLKTKKKEWLELENDQPQEPNWSMVEKELLAEIAPKHRNIVQENAMLLLSCGLLYFDLADACQKGYTGHVEKCISCFAVIYQSSNNTK